MFKQKLYELIFVNWKWTLKGLAMATGLVCGAMQANHIGPAQYVQFAAALAVAVGGALSYDAKQ